MWGICLDWSIDYANLFQRAVEYQLDTNSCKAIILKPIKDIIISSESIRVLDRPPVFTYGTIVSPINHSDIIGEIREIIWNFKRNDYDYYIEVDGIKKSKRYCADDLIEHKY